MWNENLKDFKKKTGLTTKQIAERSNLPERTVSRIFSGDTNSPYMTTLIPICKVLGCSLDDVFADTKVVVATETVAELQENVTELQENVEVAISENDLLSAENKILQNKVTTLEKEIELLKTKLMHKEELLAVHNYYTKLKCD
jgi:transcriptional regulator with XRE-family HTH domain